MKFYHCAHCGNIIAYINESGVPVVCCGEKMQELIPNSSGAAVEKHLPVVEQEDGKVTVRLSSQQHPMTEAHSIQWIALECRQGNQRKQLAPTDAPEAVFMLASGDEVIAAYAYCNLHGLWRTSC